MPANRIHTARELIAALEAFIAANPDEADQPVGFSTDKLVALNNGHGGIGWVRNVVACPDSGGALLLNAIDPEA